MGPNTKKKTKSADKNEKVSTITVYKTIMAVFPAASFS
jgi:hypothetical protein